MLKPFSSGLKFKFVIFPINKCLKYFSGNNLDKQPIIEPEWEYYLKDTAKIIINNLNASGLGPNIF